jgi:hypothetical protein
MDQLDQIVGVAGPLLRDVDTVLTEAGAPADHPVWAEIRRVRLLPGDAVHAVAALRSADLLDAAPELRADARAYAGVAESLPPPGPWSGAAAEAYDEARLRTADRLSGAPESLDERLEATADLAEALIEWMAQTRAELAAALSRILGSEEAVTLSGDGLETIRIRAAADVGEWILRSVADNYELAADLLHGSTDLAVPVPV